MLKVGITGGIGSGKSLVSEVFSHLGVPIYCADLEAKRLMNESPVIRQKIIEIFGEDIYTFEGPIDRKKMADLVFNSPKLLEYLNSIVHPEVRKDFEQWALLQNSAYVIEEAAVLFESGGYKYVDLIITVTAPLELRINRVIKRDICTREQVLARMNNQW
ncbi:MAG: dephospho-CoA kinase, partial [Bacteroidota bacterium]|nr:dephospho-CoA kinase [Bacteroidota bacterium]